MTTGSILIATQLAVAAVLGLISGAVALADGDKTVLGISLQLSIFFVLSGLTTAVLFKGPSPKQDADLDD